MGCDGGGRCNPPASRRALAAQVSVHLVCCPASNSNPTIHLYPLADFLASNSLIGWSCGPWPRQWFWPLCSSLFTPVCAGWQGAEDRLVRSCQISSCVIFCCSLFSWSTLDHPAWLIFYVVLIFLCLPILFFGFDLFFIFFFRVCLCLRSYCVVHDAPAKQEHPCLLYFSPDF